MRLIVLGKKWLRTNDVVPLRESFLPPGIVFRDRITLRPSALKPVSWSWVPREVDEVGITTAAAGVRR
jgi:hypothetical protein